MKRRLILGFTCLILSANALAHREEESLTSILWNSRSEMVEVIHQIHQHDAQYVLNKLPGLDSTSRNLTTLKGKARIALLVEDAFKIQIDDKAADIMFVGAVLDGEFILVMQEFVLGSADKLDIHFNLFESQFDKYTSRLTILLHGMNETFFFNAKTPRHTFILPVDN